MRTVFIVSWILVGLQTMLAIVLIGMYIAASVHPTTDDADWGGPVALFVGLIVLCVAIIFAAMTAMLLTRSPVARIVYTIVIGLVVVVSFLVGRSFFLLPNVLFIAAVVLTWLPASKPFFSDLPGVTYYPNIGPSGDLR